MGIFGALMVVLNLVTFATTRERVQPDPRQKSSVRADLKNVFTCGPWLVMFILTLLIFTMLVVRGSSSNYFFAYYLDQQQIRAFLSGFGLAGICWPGHWLEDYPRFAGPADQSRWLERRCRRAEPLLRDRELWFKSSAFYSRSRWPTASAIRQSSSPACP